MTTQTGKITYRVIKTTTVGFGDEQAESSTIWQGTDTKALSIKYPPSDIFGADPLFQPDIEDGYICFSTRFERQLADGTWEKCDDPRRRITPMTEIEREIDRENRRDFPGDYITSDDCDRCGGYGCPECEDDDRYNCDNCHDVGCLFCDPSPDCSNCDDHGCELCEPENFPSLCYLCYQPLASNETEICAKCIDKYTPCCIACQAELSEHQTDLCQSCEDMCEQLMPPLCGACREILTDPGLHDGDLCKECDEYYSKIYGNESQLTPWYRRLVSWLLRRQ